MVRKGGVFGRGAYEEDGPVIWEILTLRVEPGIAGTR